LYLTLLALSLSLNLLPDLEGLCEPNHIQLSILNHHLLIRGKLLFVMLRMLEGNLKRALNRSHLTRVIEDQVRREQLRN
jgi:hypothetical protein